MRLKDLLEGLTGPQREAVTHGDGPLLVIAGPGSGKTRVITHRAAYLARTVTSPERILAITFTNKAAGEMADRLERLGVGRGMTCCTFHSLCARLLRIHAEPAGLRPNFSIFDEAEQLAAMKEAVRRADLSTDNFPPRQMLAVVSHAKNRMCPPEQFREEAAGWQDKKIAEVYETYNRVLAEQNAVDFDDLLLKTARLLADYRDLRAALEQRYRYVLVDEYQDTNHAQYLIARGLSLEHRNLCVTGDPDQSIYAWRGADLSNILEFEQDFPDAKVVRLEQNYRSTPEILRAADAVIAHNRRRKAKTLWTENGAGEPVCVAECEDPHGEARFIARRIREYAEAGGRYGDVAIFYRVNALSRSIEGGLRDARIPYQVARGVAFYQRREIKDVLAYLKVAVNPDDEVSLLRIINTPTRGIGKKTIERLRSRATQGGWSVMEILARPEVLRELGRAERALQSFAALMRDVQTTVAHGTVQDAVEFVVRHSGLLAMWGSADDEDAMENVEELINAAAEYDRQHADGSGSVLDWLQQICLVSDVDAIDERLGAVTLMTLHAAKGLEFDVVFMVGLEQGLLPHERSEIERADIEEERRLCFVGMTRARRRLTLTHARWRDFRGVTYRRSKSIFLKELPESEVEWLRIGPDGEVDSEREDDEPELPASSLDFLDWRKGQLVRHPEFGVGRVLWIQPRNRRTHAGVYFSAYGEKTLVLEYANLEVIHMRLADDQDE